MKRRTKPLIVGNWKTTPATLKEAVTFIKSLEKKLFTLKKKSVNAYYFLAVPDIFVTSLIPLVDRGEIGVQNISGTTLGQETGITTPSMIASSGATFTILGHSEVRARGEDLHTLSQKVTLSLKAKLLTVLCVGESERDKEGNYLHELENDLKEILVDVDRSLFSNLVIAYEPIWAIGAPLPATTEECFEVVISLRRALATLVGIEHAKKVSILYGGAVTDDTAKSFLIDGGVDGLLLGRASQELKAFTTILESCFKN
ncbi:MAG: triose-phosphate isomerase [Candidatus Nomurabacteria bacterium]|nr:triose-phosphate isomerase [Candidatus Nomurabacteria bacterium]